MQLIFLYISTEHLKVYTKDFRAVSYLISKHLLIRQMGTILDVDPLSFTSCDIKTTFRRYLHSCGNITFHKGNFFLILVGFSIGPELTTLLFNYKTHTRAYIHTDIHTYIHTHKQTNKQTNLSACRRIVAPLLIYFHSDIWNSTVKLSDCLSASFTAT
jgi:hypothetical protein